MPFFILIDQLNQTCKNIINAICTMNEKFRIRTRNKNNQDTDIIYEVLIIFNPFSSPYLIR